MTKPVICIGAAFIDELFHAKEEMLLATTNVAFVTKTAGGVSRNIAHQLALLGVSVQLAHTLSAEILQVNGAIAIHLDQQKLLELVPKYYPD